MWHQRSAQVVNENLLNSSENAVGPLPAPKAEGKISLVAPLARLPDNRELVSRGYRIGKLDADRCRDMGGQ